MLLPYLVIGALLSYIMFYVILALAGPANSKDVPLALMCLFFLGAGCGVTAVVYSALIILGYK